jgi:undecaprenyl pyrophosphate phosphatase UppP
MSIVAFTIAYLLDIGISEQFNMPIYISLTLIVPAILIFFAEKLSCKRVLTEYKEGNKSAILITGLSR